MSRSDAFDVVVVGAGVVGASCALLLARCGFRVGVLEERLPLPWNQAHELDPRVIAAAPSAVQLFERLEVWDTIVNARACAYRRMRVWDACAPAELGFDAADEGRAALGWIVENGLIQSVLWQALQRTPGIELFCPATYESAEQRDGRLQQLRLADGTRLNTRLLIAADGGNSLWPQRLGITHRSRDYEQRAIVAHVRTERAHEYCAWQRFLPGATVAFLPLLDGRSSVVWSVPNSHAKRLLDLEDAGFCAKVGAAFDFRLGNIVATTPRLAFPLRLRLADRYVAPGFALIGDAGHVVHPLAGQGLNLGLRDVVTLCDELVRARDAQKDFAALAVLRRYERKRRSENELAAYSFDAIQRVFACEAKPVVALRALALRSIDRFAPLKRFFVHAAAGRV